MSRNQALLEEAAELVQKRCITASARGVVTYVPPTHIELIALVAEALEQGRTTKKPERVAVGPARHRLEFVEFEAKENNPPVEDVLFASNGK
jgi:hypothetical protein